MLFEIDKNVQRSENLDLIPKKPSRQTTYQALSTEVAGNESSRHKTTTHRRRGNMGQTPEAYGNRKARIHTIVDFGKRHNQISSPGRHGFESRPQVNTRTSRSSASFGRPAASSGSRR